MKSASRNWTGSHNSGRAAYVGGQHNGPDAYAAFIAFGKGSGHPAALNFGDVFSYALAKVRNLPLLFKGADFAETDIEAAVAGPG